VKGLCAFAIRDHISYKTSVTASCCDLPMDSQSTRAVKGYVHMAFINTSAYKSTCVVQGCVHGIPFMSAQKDVRVPPTDKFSLLFASYIHCKDHVSHGHAGNEKQRTLFCAVISHNPAEGDRYAHTCQNSIRWRNKRHLLQQPLQFTTAHSCRHVCTHPHTHLCNLASLLVQPKGLHQQRA